MEARDGNIRERGGVLDGHGGQAEVVTVDGFACLFQIDALDDLWINIHVGDGTAEEQAVQPAVAAHLPFERVDFCVEEETVRVDGGGGEQVSERGTRHDFRAEQDEREGREEIKNPAQERGGFGKFYLESVTGKDGWHVGN